MTHEQPVRLQLMRNRSGFVCRESVASAIRTDYGANERRSGSLVTRQLVGNDFAMECALRDTDGKSVSVYKFPRLRPPAFP
jgi:hypothetical protein